MKRLILVLLSASCLCGCFSVSMYGPGASSVSSQRPAHDPSPAPGFRVYLFPLFYTAPREGGRKYDFLWPLLRINTSPSDSQFALWPLFERRSSDERSTLSLPLFLHIDGPGAPSFCKWMGAVPDGTNTSFNMIYPIFYQESVDPPPAGEDAAPQIRLWGLAPLIGHGSVRTKDGEKTINYILPPLFRVVSGPKGSEFGIWPLFGFKDTDTEKQTDLLGPLYHSHSTETEGDVHFLWPLYHEKVEEGHAPVKTFMGVINMSGDEDEDY